MRAISSHDGFTPRALNCLVWWYGDDGLYALDGQVKSSITISVRQNTNNALTRAIWKSGELSSALLKFSFYNLSLDTQLTFKILLMIPLGGLVIAFLRQVIGVKTFGTFMPVLIALAFRETGLLAGLVLFVLVVIAGLYVAAAMYFGDRVPGGTTVAGVRVGGMTDRELRDDRAPPAVAGEPIEGGQHVLAQRVGEVLGDAVAEDIGRLVAVEPRRDAVAAGPTRRGR